MTKVYLRIHDLIVMSVVDTSSSIGEDVEGPRVKRFKQMRKQDLVEEALEQSRKLEDQAARLERQEKLLDKLKGMEKQSVCFSTPLCVRNT